MTAIRHAFEAAGYSRYPPRYKPPLTDAHKRARLEFCIKMREKDSDWWRKVVWTDETPVRVGAHRGQVWITRKKGEAYHEDCVNVRFKKYTDLQFWGCFSTEMRGPYHIYATETAAEKKAAAESLDEVNMPYHVEAQLLKERFHAEQQIKPPSKRLKRPPKPDMPLKTQGKNLKEGVDWYRYREEVLRPKLLPFCQQIIQAYGECYLLEDGAASHTADQNLEEYEISGLHRINWPANSPDFNAIEMAWYFLKRKVIELPYIASNIEKCKQAWHDVWEKLEQDRIGGWVSRIRPRMEICKQQRGDNKFKG